MKKNLKIILLLIFAFLGLVYFNTIKNRQALVGPQTSLEIDLASPPTQAQVNTPVPFSWQVDTNSSFKLQSTTIYYGRQSSPSALLKTDSPDAVGYTNHSQGYLKGEFFLPYTFDTKLTFDQPQTLYYRAYARVNNDHLWTPEYQILVK